MQKPMMTVAATAALVLCGFFWVAQATPLAGSTGRPSQEYTLIEKIGCTKAGDICPYGQRVIRRTGHGPGCEPCNNKQGSKNRDRDDRDYEPRRYQDYGDYEPRRYRQYDEPNYEEPRRYRDYDDGQYDPRRYREY
jgi:hypothetical protein